MKAYDIIIVGGGASGLSLASHLARSPLRDRSILIVEKDAKDKNDRTWCYWANQPTFYDDIVYRSWNQLQVLGEHFEKTLDLHDYRYNMIRGIDFYRFSRQTVSECPHVEFLQGKVELIKDGDQQATVLVDGKHYNGTWIFDSLFNWSTFKPDLSHYHAIKQQFKGWEIEASGQPFNPQVATFLDFRIPQKNGTHFFYVLPFSEQWALVESVLCTTNRVDWELCEQALQFYIKNILGIKAYNILREEQGINPLTDWRFPRKLGKHIMTIGNHGGMVKPSTGYAFLRMQEDSSAIINSLLKIGHPFSPPTSSRRYRYFDTVMLEIMTHHAERIEPILTSLFKRNPVERIFRFLDEIASLGENLMMMPSLPPQLLFQAFLQLDALRRVLREKYMYSYSHPTALVIGAGLGGIVTAARLARAGFTVKVLEKQETPGGRCSQLIRDGHRFDIGATLFLMPEVFAETYTALGESMEDHLELHRIDPTYRIRFEDDTQIALTSNLNSMEQQLEAIEPGSFGGLLRYLVEGYDAYHLSLQRFVGRNFYHFSEYFSLQNLPLLFKLKALVKHYDNIGHYFHDPRLKAAFTFQNMYLGLSPFDAPATYSLVQYTELAEGVWYPIGGIYRIIESLAGIAENYGVNFVYSTPVKQIEVTGNRATGVVLQDGSRLSADVIVVNADLPYVYSHLLPDSAEAHRLEQLKYTCSAIMFYWGVDKVYPQLGTHNVFLADDYRTSFDRIFNDHLLPDEPSFYVHAPARADPSAAPDGQDTLMVLVPVGHIDAGTIQNWDALQARARSAVIHRLAASTGIFGLEQHLKFEISYTPCDWLSLFNLAKGAAFGLSHNFMQVGYLRPHNQHHKYSNLYFVGSSTHPGTGLPMVLLSARLTTERILKESNVPNPVLSLRPALAV